MFLSTPSVALSGLMRGIMNPKVKMFENIFFSFNQVDLQNMMDPKREKRSHQSKFVKQFCYYTIIFILQISLTLYSVVTVATTKEDIVMMDTVGRTYIFTPSQVFITLGVGWAAFVLALILNILYYVLHPSQVSLHFN